MPPPIVPAPTTAARVMSVVGVSFGDVRAPWRPRARRRTDAGAPSIRSRPRSRRTARAREPSRRRTGSVRPASMRVDGGERRARRPCAVFASARARRCARVDAAARRRRRRSAISRVLRISCALRFRLARTRSRPCSRSPSTIAIDDARGAALSAPATGLPSVHISSASSAPREPRQALRAAGARE